MKRTIRLFSFALLLVLLVSMTGTPASPAYAAQTTINSSNQGWLHSSGFQSPGNTNYLVGYRGNNYRDFFVFDLPSVSGNVLGVMLRVNVAGYSSVDASETIEFYDVSTPTSALADGTGGTDAYNDLGTGALYGSATFTGADAYTYVDIPLNASAVAAVSAALGGQFALGGAMSTYGGNNEFVFGDSLGYTAQLIVITDTIPPVVTVPWDMTVEATGASGAAVTYTVFATDETSPMNPAVICDPASGSTFALDANTLVSCSATDDAGNTGYGSFHVQVVDTTSPVVLVPSDISLSTPNPSGAVVTYSASAFDLVDGSLAPSCDWPSGSTFPVGLTLVTCSAVDAHSNVGAASFSVSISRDDGAPEFSLVLDNPNEATSPAGAIINYTASFSDNGSGLASSSCAPASGSFFPIGTTTVNCTAIDNAGNISTPSFDVIVQDTRAPELFLPADIFVQQTAPDGAVVTYEIAASDLVSVSPAVVCDSPSGATFGVGMTTVNCTTSDDQGNTNNGSFNVIVSASSTATFLSLGKYDGTLKETKETSGVASSPNTSSGYLDVGDGLSDVQVLSVLHFDTSSLPDNAVITSVRLQVKLYKFAGNNPFASLGNLLVDIASAFFGPEMALKSGDFANPASANNMGFFNTSPLPNSWYEAVLDPASFSSLNTGGTTQFRIRFALDDNDDGRSNLARFYSGNASVPAYRPMLIVEYYVP